MEYTELTIHSPEAIEREQQPSGSTLKASC